MFGQNLRDTLRAVSQFLEIPVSAILLLLLAATVFLLGTVIVEAFSHAKSLARRRDKLTSNVTDADGALREGLAVRQVRAERARLENRLKISEVVAKIAPMFGLLGTLIPLGPGILALGRGDTFTLAQSLNTAFDTTVAGVFSAAVALVISAVRRRWYTKHLLILEAETEALLDEKKQI
jgi:biopolymer transport protein ExbB/TolQ